jgi:hypothetical protein
MVAFVLYGTANRSAVFAAHIPGNDNGCRDLLRNALLRAHLWPDPQRVVRKTRQFLDIFAIFWPAEPSY